MDKIMMNRYITALLVVLTATGIEAQAYQSALKAARRELRSAARGGDVALEELCRHSAFQGKEAEIRSFIKAIRSVQDKDELKPAPALWKAQDEDENAESPQPHRLPRFERSTAAWLSPALATTIQIRAPSL